MKQRRAGQAASVVRPPNSLVWRVGLLRAKDRIYARFAQDLEDDPHCCEPDITVAQIEEENRREQERREADAQIEKWIQSLRHCPPVLVTDMPTLAEVPSFYDTGTVKVPGYPVLR